MRGYKGLVEQVKLDDLGAIDILHGENNVIRWLLGAQARRRAWVLVTDDTGQELEHVGARATIEVLEETLDRLFGSCAPSSS